MNFVIRPMTAQDAQAIAGWHYDGPYSFYDMAQDADDLAELLDPANWRERYQAALDEQGALEIGLGLRPDLTGQGLGLAFNARAIRLYEKAGFRTVRHFQQATNGGSHAFLAMSRE